MKSNLITAVKLIIPLLHGEEQGEEGRMQHNPSFIIFSCFTWKQWYDVACTYIVTISNFPAETMLKCSSLSIFSKNFPIEYLNRGSCFKLHSMTGQHAIAQYLRIVCRRLSLPMCFYPQFKITSLHLSLCLLKGKKSL